MKAYTFHAFVSLFFILLGVFGGMALCLVAKNALLMESLAVFFKEKPDMLYSVGLLVCGVSSLLFLLFYFFNKKSVYQIEMNRNVGVSINRKILTQFFTRFFESEMSTHPVPFTLKIQKRNVELLADFSDISLQEHESILESLEPKLIEQFTKRFGLPNEMVLSIFCKKR